MHILLTDMIFHYNSITSHYALFILCCTFTIYSKISIIAMLFSGTLSIYHIFFVTLYIAYVIFIMSLIFTFPVLASYAMDLIAQNKMRLQFTNIAGCNALKWLYGRYYMSKKAGMILTSQDRYISYLKC